jgi:hypothetical protein
MDPDSCRVGWFDVLISVRDGLCHAPDQFAHPGCCRRTSSIGWLSTAPKAVTTPIAIEVTQTVGGIPSLAAVLAITSGVLVAISIQSLLRWAKITDWRALDSASLS